MRVAFPATDGVNIFLDAPCRFLFGTTVISRTCFSVLGTNGILIERATADTKTSMPTREPTPLDLTISNPPLKHPLTLRQPLVHPRYDDEECRYDEGVVEAGPFGDGLFGGVRFGEIFDHETGANDPAHPALKGEVCAVVSKSYL